MRGFLKLVIVWSQVVSVAVLVIAARADMVAGNEAGAIANSIGAVAMAAVAWAFCPRRKPG